jgi:hypothetical protein
MFAATGSLQRGAACAVGGLVLALVLLALVLAGPARAGDRAEFEFRFDKQRPGAVTGGDLRIVYKAPGDPEGKPPAIRHVLIAFPRRTQVNPGGGLCEASNEELHAMGRDACPPESLIGDGRITVMSGFGQPFDPYPTDVWLYRTPEGMLELLQQPGTNTTLAVERGRMEGRRLEFNPPYVPGGPPDFAIGVRTVEWRLYGARQIELPWLSTPTRCRPARGWVTRGEFRFQDGGSAVERSVMPCRRR